LCFASTSTYLLWINSIYFVWLKCSPKIILKLFVGVVPTKEGAMWAVRLVWTHWRTWWEQSSCRESNYTIIVWLQIGWPRHKNCEDCRPLRLSVDWFMYFADNRMETSAYLLSESVYRADDYKQLVNEWRMNLRLESWHSDLSISSYLVKLRDFSVILNVVRGRRNTEFADRDNIPVNDMWRLSF